MSATAGRAPLPPGRPKMNRGVGIDLPRLYSPAASERLAEASSLQAQRPPPALLSSRSRLAPSRTAGPAARSMSHSPAPPEFQRILARGPDHPNDEIRRKPPSARPASTIASTIRTSSVMEQGPGRLSSVIGPSRRFSSPKFAIELGRSSGRSDRPGSIPMSRTRVSRLLPPPADRGLFASATSVFAASVHVESCVIRTAAVPVDRIGTGGSASGRSQRMRRWSAMRISLLPDQPVLRT